MIKSTTNYEMFKFRTDNRDGGVKRSHVEHIKELIKANNLLHLRPIVVDKNMDVYDGQHRLVAARELQVPIYYTIEERLVPKDIIHMNTNKQWRLGDFMNFYVSNHYPEYIKFDKFIKKEGLQLRVAFALLKGRTDDSRKDFQQGNFVMPDVEESSVYSTCKDIVAFLTMHLPHMRPCTSGPKFWKPLIALVNADNFDYSHFIKNLEKHIHKIGPRVSEKDYLKMFEALHNYRAVKKVRLIDEDVLE